MNAIRNVFTALANLAGSINALAGVLDTATGRLRQQLSLDEQHILEHQPDDGALEEAPPVKRNGRKTAAV